MLCNYLWITLFAKAIYFVSIQVPPPLDGEYMKNANKKETLRRLNIIKGHLKKVAKMVEEDKYCIDILQQSLAVQNALKQVDGLILDQHLHQCVTEAIKKGSSGNFYWVFWF